MGKNGNKGKPVYSSLPARMSSRVVLGVLEVLRRRSRKSGQDPNPEKERNRIRSGRIAKHHMPSVRRNNGYIEDQNEYVDVVYGKHTMRYSGCEVIAVYNALRHLYGRQRFSLAALIAEFEKDGILREGRFGTSPRAVNDFLLRLGLRTRFCTKESGFEEAAKESDAVILTYYNDRKDIYQGLHSVCLTREPKLSAADKDGGKAENAGRNKKDTCWLAHNVYGNGAKPKAYPDISTFLNTVNAGKASGLCMIGTARH